MPEEVVEKQESKMSKMASEMSTFCYNSDDGTVMGRTGSSWLKITGFYILFYSCLACFFGICLHVALMTIPEDRPKLVGRSNRPTISPARKDFRSIDFTKDMKKYQQVVDVFIKEYDAINKNATSTNTTVMTIAENAVYAPCLATDANYVTGDKACLFMAINRRFDWVPAVQDHIICKWDIGLGGTGSINPGFGVDVYPPPGDLENYYPWASTVNNGEQPVWAIKISRNETDKGKSEEAFLKCNLCNIKGVIYSDYASFIFEVIYKAM